MISTGTGCTALTPKVFWTVTAVIALAAYDPVAEIALMSAWIPAPPTESLPAIVRTVLYFFIMSEMSETFMLLTGSPFPEYVFTGHYLTYFGIGDIQVPKGI